MKPSDRTFQLIRQHAPSDWQITVNAMIEREPTIHTRSGAESTYLNLVNQSATIISAVNQNFELDQDSKLQVEKQLSEFIKGATRTIGLMDSEGSKSFPIVKAQRALESARIDVSEDILQAVNAKGYESTDLVASLAISTLKRGNTKLSLALFEALRSDSYDFLQIDTADVTSAYINGIVRAQGAATTGQSLKMQSELVEILKVTPVDLDKQIKGQSIVQFCADSPDLSFINNHISNTALHRILSDEQSNEVNDHSDYSLSTSNRVF